MMIGDLIFLAVLALGAAMALKARGIRDSLVSFYKSAAITRHLNMPGWVLGLRLVGIGCFLAAAFALANQLHG